MLLTNITMIIYRLSFHHNGDNVVFTIGLDNQFEQFEICSSNYNAELYVSLFDGYVQKEKDGSIVKIKLKTLITLVEMIFNDKFLPIYIYSLLNQLKEI